MANGRHGLPSEHHIELGVAEHEGVVAVEQHQVERLAEGIREHGGELEAAETGAEYDDARAHQPFTATAGCGTMRR